MLASSYHIAPMVKNNPLGRSKKDGLPAVIALDLDGTLLQSDGSVSARTLAVIRQCARLGMRPVIATARPPRSVKACLPAAFPPGPWICYNGAEVYEAGRRIIQNALSPELAREVIATIRRLAPAASISFEMDDELISSCPLEGPWIHRVAPDLYREVTKPVAKILFGNTPLEIVEAIRAKLPCDCRVLTFNDGDLPLADIVAPGVSKAWALRELLSRYDMTMADVIAFGDDSIDIEMLCESGLGVAMANALPQVKAAADYVTLSNDADGVAEALERLICNHR